MSYFHTAVALHPPTGVARQMSHEANAAAALGLQWTVWLCDGSELGPLLRRWPAFLRASLLRLRFYARLVRLSRRGHRILLRHSPGDPFQFAASLFMRSYYTVHHTFEEEELAASPHRLAPLLLTSERVMGRRLVARAHGIVCVTSEIARYELDRLPPRAERVVVVYPNGILYSDDVNTAVDERGDCPEVVFLASHFAGWHGLDQLLTSLSESRAKGVLHLAGEVPEHLMRLASKDPRVRLHGTLIDSEVDGLIGRSWVGLSSFGLAQKGMTEACTLKVREYLRAGLPVYAGHCDSALPPAFPYFRRGPANWDTIVAYAQATRNVPRGAISEAARPFIDKKVLLQRLYDALEAVPGASRSFARSDATSSR
jgi:hypothetical protein